MIRSICVLLVLGSSAWALTPEDCQPLVQHLSLLDPYMLFGRSHLVAAFSNSAEFGVVLEALESHWMDVTPSPFSTQEVVLQQADKINGTCFQSTFNVSHDRTGAAFSASHVNGSFQVLPSCLDCLLLSSTITHKHMERLLAAIGLDASTNATEVTTRVLYLMARDTAPTSSDLERFRQQARCLGFSGEPQFVYDQKHDFCAEGVGRHLSFD
ncbi:uncharacterized protein V6R79_002454 [Siganus canaliculatus]